MIMRKLPKHFSLKFLLLWVAWLVLFLFFAWIVRQNPQAIPSLNRILTQYAEFFTLFRWAMIAALIVSWPKILRYFAVKRNWQPAQTRFWLNQRWRLAAWVIVLELLIGQCFL